MVKILTEPIINYMNFISTWKL